VEGQTELALTACVTGVSSTLIIQTIALGNCSCSWAVTPSSTGSFSAADACITDFTLENSGAATLTVAIDCGVEGSANLTQAIEVAAATAPEDTGDETADETGEAGTGGGGFCSASLMGHHMTGSSTPILLLFLVSLTALGIMRRKLT